MLKKAITSAILGIMLVTEAGAATITYTYANEDYAFWGTRKKENYDVAIRIDDPRLIGKKITAINATLYATSGISHTSLWLSKELRLENRVNAPDITSVAVTPDTYGEMKATLDDPYVITGDGVYAGYSFATDELNEQTVNPLLLSTAVNKNGFYLHTSRSVLKWMNYGVDRLQATAVIDVKIEGDFPEYSLDLTSLPEIYGKAGTMGTVIAEIQNTGLEPVKEIEYSYTIDGVTKSAKYTFSTPVKTNFVNPAQASLTLETPEKTGAYDITLTIDKINGNNNMSEAKSAKTTFNSVSIVPKHLPLMEEYTGTWCGWCPRGWFALEKMNKLYGDEFIGIAYHNGDPMAVVPESDYPIIVNGFPSASIDRGEEMDPYYGLADDGFGIETAWKDARSIFAPATLGVYAWWTDDTQTAIDVTSFTKFVVAKEDADYRLAYVLCADDLHSVDTEWDQHNYYPDYASKYIGTELYELCEMGSTINDLHFNEVALIADTPEGIDGSLPGDIEADKVIEDHYTFRTDGVKELIQNPAKLFVVAMIIDGKTGKVVNAAKGAVAFEAAGIDAVRATECEEVSSVRYTDLQGRIVKSPNAGVYVKTTRFKDGSIRSEKIMKK